MTMEKKTVRDVLVNLHSLWFGGKKFDLEKSFSDAEHEIVDITTDDFVRFQTEVGILKDFVGELKAAKTDMICGVKHENGGHAYKTKKIVTEEEIDRIYQWAIREAGK